MKCYLQCKVDGERLGVSKRQLQWLIEHATDYELTKLYDIVIENGSIQGRYTTVDGLLTVLKMLQH
jgi:hypothetical protein